MDHTRRDITIVTAHNSCVTKHKLSLSRALTSAKTQLNLDKRSLPRADSKNILTFSGKCWCCHCSAELLLSFCRGAQCHCPRQRGLGFAACFAHPGSTSRHCLCLQHPLSFLPAYMTLQSWCSPELVPSDFSFSACHCYWLLNVLQKI